MGADRIQVVTAALLWLGVAVPTTAAAQSTPVRAPTLTPTSTRTRTPTATATATHTPTRTPTPLPLVADTNCDGRGTAADFCAAIIVSGNASRFAACGDADPFRGRRLVDRDFIPILADIFDTFATPWTPTPSPTPSITRTPAGTNTPTRTAPPTATATASATKTDTPSPTPTPTATATREPTHTPTPSLTRTFTPTRTHTPVPTPTGIAFQLSGDWAAHWGGQVSGARLGRALPLDTSGSVQTTLRFFDQRVCLITGVAEEFVFDYTFTFRTDGTGTAAAHWTYGANTNCAVCEVTDSATLRRVDGPR